MNSNSHFITENVFGVRGGFVSHLSTIRKNEEASEFTSDMARDRQLPIERSNRCHHVYGLVTI